MPDRSVTNLYRYPVKGLSAQPLDAVRLEPGRGFPFDRIWAVTNGRQGFDPARPEPWPKTRFLMLMLHEALATLDCSFVEEDRSLRIRRDGADLFHGCLDDPDDRRQLADCLAAVAGSGPGPETVSAPGLRFTDVSVVSPGYMNAISLVNLASVRTLSDMVGADLNPLRFRANLYFDGGAAWEEFDWIDREVEAGGTRLRILKRTRRCPATQVDPVTAVRDIDVPTELKRHFGHADMGIYAEVIGAGRIMPGDEVTVRASPAASREGPTTPDIIPSP